MIKYFAKRFMMRKLNDCLQNLKQNENIETWRLRILSYSKFLNNLMEYLEDGNVSDEEAEKIMAQCKELVK